MPKTKSQRGATRVHGSQLRERAIFQKFDSIDDTISLKKACETTLNSSLCGHSPEATMTKETEVAIDIVAAYLSSNHLPAIEIPNLVASVYAAVTSLTGATPDAVAQQQPAVPIKKSVMPEFIICLEDGKRFKSLKRHIGTCYDLTPDAYRQKWGLPPDYPMVAPAYAKARSQLAKNFGLGKKATKASSRGTKKAA